MVDPANNFGFSWRFVAESEDARREAELLRQADLIGLDTETYWNYQTKRTNVSLVQIASSLGDVLVVDALTAGVEPLREIIEFPGVRMVAHNARFDELVLLDAGLRPQGFVDTLRLARAALDLPSYSLAAVAEHLFGLPLDKTLRTSNWRRRPLTRAQITYAATDALITLHVYNELRRRLEDRGTFEAALHASMLSGEPRGERRERNQRRVAPKPAIPLTPEDKSIVTKLKKWRLERSHAQRVPAYMICPDRTLDHLAQVRPATLEALREIHGLGESKIASFGEDLLQALRRACGG
ncbi:MAG: HRDC domain-containing protein [Acidobacteria bacterium]|nr:HRDC domain-containing protein [Acidobacteriota bacterium]